MLLSDVIVVDKTLFNLLIIKISEISLKLCVSFNDSYQRQTRIAQFWLQVNFTEFIRNDQRPLGSHDP